MMWHDRGWDTGSWVLMAVFMLIFWTAVVVGIVYLVRTPRHGQPAAPGPYVAGPPHAPVSPPPDAGTAQRILDERFARGEIDEDEYKRRRDVLGGS